MAPFSSFKKLFFAFFQSWRLRHGKPKLSNPVSHPLSPRRIDKYVENDNGQKEENKAYIPVTLLIKAIEDKRLLNIAVTGNYGVGKSSVINTATSSLSCRHRCIDITLASLQTLEERAKAQEPDVETGLQDINKKNLTPGATDLHSAIKKPLSQRVTDKQIEYSILQQILYHERPQTTPKSRIRRIHRTKWYKPFVIAFCILLALVSVILIRKPGWANLDLLLGMNSFSEPTLRIIGWGSLLIIASLLFLTCWYIGRHYGLSVARIGYKSVELKVKDDVSVFNAYLDEIVYFFESTKYDVVVFEDLDRFEDRDVIFYKLRELNTILNNSKSLKRRRIKFVYAVLDELFESKERVKFFDYIVSVIPVVDSLNSYNKLIELLPKQDIDKLGKKELLGLCDYFEDMRLLLNIVNEYNQFKPLIDSAVMNEKVLFGLMVYKNYVPIDFSKMYNRHGVVATVIDRTPTYRKQIIDDKLNQIENCYRESLDAKQEKEQRIVALRRKYLDTAKKLSAYASYDVSVLINGKRYLFDTIMRDKNLFSSVLDSSGRFNHGNSFTDIPSQQEVERNLEKGFNEQLKDIEIELDNKEALISQKKEKLQFEVSYFPKEIKDIYRRNPDLLDNELVTLAEDQKALVKYMILHGYLDYDYQHYISHFYPNSLKRTDRNFVMKAGRNEGVFFDTPLINVDEVLKRFDKSVFESNKSLLNVFLVEHIFTQNRYNVFRSAVIKCIYDYKCTDFMVVCCRAKDRNLKSFFTALLKEYDYWDEIDNCKVIDQDELRLVYLNHCQLDEEHISFGFKSWLNSHYSFLERYWDRIPEDRAVQLFGVYKPIFDRLSLRNTPDKVFNDIVENQWYALGRGNFSAIIRRLGFWKSYDEAPISSIIEFKNQALIRTMKQNWKRMLLEVFPNHHNLKEKEFAQVLLLNSSNMPHGVIKPYLSRQTNKIHSAEMIDETALSFAYDCSFVEPSWKNISYFVKIKQRIPVAFLNNSKITEPVSETLSPEEESKLRKMIVFSNDLDFPAYKRIVPCFSLPFSAVEERISQSRIKFLIGQSYLILNKETFGYTKGSGLEVSLILNDIASYLNDPEPYPVSTEMVKSVLGRIVSKKGQCDYLRSIKDKSVIADPGLEEAILPLLLGQDLKPSDINEDLLISIIKNANNKEDKVVIGRRAILSQDKANATTIFILKAMGSPYSKFVSSSKSSSVPYGNSTIRIANDLKKKGLLSEVIRDPDSLTVTKNHPFIDSL